MGKKNKEQDEKRGYDYVFEDQIAFVVDEQIKGTNVSDSSWSSEGSSEGCREGCCVRLAEAKGRECPKNLPHSLDSRDVVTVVDGGRAEPCPDIVLPVR